GALGHEVDATEQNVLCLRARRRELRQLERVAPRVGILDDLVALVVVTEDDQAVAQLLPCRHDAVIQFRGGHKSILARYGVGALGPWMAPLVEHGASGLTSLPLDQRRQDDALLALVALGAESCYAGGRGCLWV